MKDLSDWKNSTRRKPLILRGARQVGKTWLLKEFGRQEFSELAYVNMENNEPMQMLFAGSLEPPRLLDGISEYLNKRVTPETLLILDEIQEIPRALTALKYFNEDAPDQAVAVAGSLLGMASASGISFPVGKVTFLDLFPMTFKEYLVAVSEGRFVKMIDGGDFDMLKVFSEPLTDLMRRYLYVGGMPEAVDEYVHTKDLQNVRQIQNDILATYKNDFSKHSSGATANRCREIWQTIPSQLARDTKRFIFGVIKEGARGSEYRAALQCLEDCGLVHLVRRVSKAGIPLKAYEKEAMFKLFIVDVGLLGAMSGLDASTLIEGDRLFQEFKGAYTEQFVCQELIGECGLTLNYWSSESNPTEIDFLFQAEGKIYPVEVKAAENLKSKSLAAFCKRYDLNTGIRLSLADYREESWMRNIPLFSIASIKPLVKETEKPATELSSKIASGK
ncbi:MAG: ATP-binding protein [Actinomycetia bacterium]|nr:ATP-binding protein [Actinomycetes bacterium]